MRLDKTLLKDKKIYFHMISMLQKFVPWTQNTLISIKKKKKKKLAKKCERKGVERRQEYK